MQCSFRSTVFVPTAFQIRTALMMRNKWLKKCKVHLCEMVH